MSNITNGVHLLNAQHPLEMQTSLWNIIFVFWVVSSQILSFKKNVPAQNYLHKKYIKWCNIGLLELCWCNRAAWVGKSKRELTVGASLVLSKPPLSEALAVDAKVLQLLKPLDDFPVYIFKLRRSISVIQREVNQAHLSLKWKVMCALLKTSRCDISHA